MDTWSVARISLDLLFAVTLAGIVAGFLYRREKRLRSQLAESLSRALESGLDGASQPVPTARSQEVVPSRRANGTPQNAFGGRASTRATETPKISKAQKYLEAVRMYREGRQRNEIERELGISFMELELLGRIK